MHLGQQQLLTGRGLKLATLLLAVHSMMSRLRLQVHALGQNTVSALAAYLSRR